jgi:hypothetical protein
MATATAFWQNLEDTVLPGKGRVINVSYDSIQGGSCNVRMTRKQAIALRDALVKALKEAR